MPWSGGSFSRVHDWTTDAAASIDIEASRMDAEDDNLRDGINDCVHKGGQNTATGDLPMGGNNHTGVGNATARDEYASAADVMDQDLIFYSDTGAANAYVITPSPAITGYEIGQRFVFFAANANTGASTVNINGLGTKNIITTDGQPLDSGAILAGRMYEITYDGTSFEMTSPPSEIPDSMLSSNVPLKDDTNVFTASQTISSTAPEFRITETDASADNGNWLTLVSSEALSMRAYDDSWSSSSAYMVVNRTGTTIDSINFANGTLQSGGTAVKVNDSDVNHDSTTGFVANEHIDHTAVTLTAGSGLSGGGDISASRSFAIDISTSELSALQGNQIDPTTDGFLVDDNGSPARMAYSSAGCPVTTVSGTTDTLSSSDINTYKRYTNASGCTVTLNTGLGVVGNWIVLEQAAAGQVTTTGTSTRNGANGTGTSGAQYSAIVLWCVAANTWTVLGDAG